jgi:hypothetical protein
MSTESVIVGLDFGGVLSVLSDRKEVEHISTSINMPDAIDTLSKLKDPSVVKREYIFKIISFCGYSRAVQTLCALKAYPQLFDDMYFVKDRASKAQMCKYLGCHIMVDDRVGILNDVKRMNPRIMTVLFGEKKTTSYSNPHKCVQNWKELFELIENYKVVSTKPDPLINISGLIHNVGH